MPLTGKRNHRSGDERRREHHGFVSACLSNKRGECIYPSFGGQICLSCGSLRRPFCEALCARLLIIPGKLLALALFILGNQINAEPLPGAHLLLAERYVSAKLPPPRAEGGESGKELAGDQGREKFRQGAERLQRRAGIALSINELAAQVDAPWGSKWSADTGTGAGTGTGTGAGTGSVQGLSAKIIWAANGFSLDVAASAVVLGDGLPPVTDLKIHCGQIQLRAGHWQCAEASAQARWAGQDLRAGPLALGWHPGSGAVTLQGPWSGPFGATGQVYFMTLSDAATPDRAQVRQPAPTAGSGAILDIQVHQFALAELVEFLDFWPVVQDAVQEWPVAVTAGTLSLVLRVQLGGERISFDGRVQVTDLAFSDRAGLLAAEDLGFSLKLAQDAGKSLQVQVRFNQGAAFLNPWFIDFADMGALTAVAEATELDWTGGWPFSGTLKLAALDWNGNSQLQVTDARWTQSGLVAADIDFYSTDLALLSESLLQPAGAGTVLGDMLMSGVASAHFGWRDGQPDALKLRWREVQVQDRQRRFGVAGANGELFWTRELDAAPSWLSVSEGFFLGLPFQGFSTHWQWQGHHLRLLQPFWIPILDGGPSIDEFEWFYRETSGWQLSFSGGLRAVDLDALTERLGWPRFAGRIAGIVPRVRYQAGALELDGQLRVQAFDGEIIIREVMVRDLFGPAPVLELSADIRRLDLALLTHAFTLGRIEGRISGEVSGLQLVAWELQAMDLYLATPRNNPGRRRISQRAVENLTDLGGGLQAAVSSQFLRLFDDFSYQRLGFGCELRGSVCTLSGVGSAPGDGFFLVQGGGLPSVTVIGHNQRVDWPELMQRLQAVRAESPTVQ